MVGGAKQSGRGLERVSGVNRVGGAKEGRRGLETGWWG